MTCREQGVPGSRTDLATAISEIGYILLPYRDLSEITLERRNIRHQNNLILHTEMKISLSFKKGCMSYWLVILRVVVPLLFKVGSTLYARGMEFVGICRLACLSVIVSVKISVLTLTLTFERWEINILYLAWTLYKVALLNDINVNNLVTFTVTSTLKISFWIVLLREV